MSLAADKPVVSILSCAYNQEHSVPQTLESMLGQDFQLPYEIIVGEDCSLDGTRAVLLDFQRRHPDKIKLVLHEKNVGVFENFKSVVRELSGEFTALCGPDDYWTYAGKIRLQYNFFQQHPDCNLVHTRFAQQDVESGKVTEVVLPDSIDPTNSDQLLFSGNFIGAQTVMIRTSVLKKAIEEGLLDRGFLMEDYPLWLYATETGSLGFIDTCTTVWRKYGESMTNPKSIRKALLFWISIEEIRAYMASRRNIDVVPVLAASYKNLLHIAFRNREYSLAQVCLKKLIEYGKAGKKDYIKGHRLLQKIAYIVGRNINKSKVN